MEWDPDQLAALAAAVSEGSFEAAARRLHVTPSAISQRLKALETRVGRVLLVRSRPISPTQSGATLLRLARQIEAVLDDAEHELGQDGRQETPTVALAVNADSLATWLPNALAAVEPAVTFDLRRADETRTAELLRDGSVTAAVTASAEPVPGCTIEPLGRMRYAPRACAEFVARWFTEGVTPASLARAPMVVFDRSDELQDRYLRRRSRRPLQPPRHYIPGSGAFVEAVRLGLGWGMVPDLQTSEALVGFDPGGGIDVSLYWQQWRLRSSAIERVAAVVRAEAKLRLLAPAQRGLRQRHTPD
jgi:LysR family transcriptional regulator (chromosome initiation inhibitor)